jgi:hypothetical protein
VQFERRTEASIARCASSDPTPMKMGNRRATEEVAATGPIGGKGRTNERIG